MTFDELLQEILGDVPKATGRDIHRASNRVVGQLNRRLGGVYTIDIAYTSGAAATGYTWTAGTYELTLADYIKALKKVWVGDDEFIRKDYDFVINVSTGYYFATKGRDAIVFPSAVLSATSDDLVLEIYKKIINFTSTARSTTMTIPTQMERVLVDGVMTWLLALPKYKDEDLYAIFKEQYERGLDELETLENFRFTRSMTELEYSV